MASKGSSFQELLGSSSRDFLVDNQGNKVALSSIGGAGGIVGLYFSASWCGPCRNFTPRLVEIYKECQQKKQKFDVVFISSDQDARSMKDYFGHMPWLAVPYDDLSQIKSALSAKYEVRGIPTLVLLDGADASKILERDGRSAVSFPGNDFPFDKMPALIKTARDKAQDDAKNAPADSHHSGHLHPIKLNTKYDGLVGCDGCGQRVDGAHYECTVGGCDFATHISCTDHKKPDLDLASLMASTGEATHLVDAGDKKHDPADLKGKAVILYFSASWCPPCQRLTPELAKVYQGLQAAGKKVEVVYVPNDRDSGSFKTYLHKMPWPAVPFEAAKLRSKLGQLFSIQGFPTLVALDEQGGILADAADEGFLPYLMKHGENVDLSAYAKHKKDKEAAMAAWIKTLPATIKTGSHSCELTFNALNYGGRPWGCDVCGEGGQGPAYHCEKCNFDAHPHCIEETNPPQQE